MSIEIKNIPDYHLWYLVGLIASDGYLSVDGRHIDITGKNYHFLNEIKTALGIKNCIGVKYGKGKRRCYRIQISSKSFYQFLISIGLKTKKSLDLGIIEVPEQTYVDFLRGLIDGDGCIRRWIHPTNKREQWSLRIYSGSRDFIEWISDRTKEILRVEGKVHPVEGINNGYILKYGKMAAKVILDKCYYSNSLNMERKFKLARKCVDSYKGWKKSQTVGCC